MSRRALICFVFVLVLALVTSLSQGKEEPKVVTKHDKNGVLTVVIDMVGGKKKVEKGEKVDESKLKVDSLSKQAAALIESSISAKEATQIAQDLLTLANEIRNIANLIPSDQEKEKKDLKDQLTVIVSNLVQQAESPKALLLESSLAIIAQKKKAEETQKVDYDKVSVEDLLNSNKKSTKGAKTLIIPSNPWDWAALGLNLIDGIGTYSQKFNKVGQFMSGKVADKLDKWKMKPLASIARNTGSSISSYSKKLEPYEQKAAKFIAPVVKSKPFQVIRKSVNVVSAVLSVQGGLKALNLIKGGGVKLPKNYAALKTSLSTVVKKSSALIKNAKTFVNSSGKLTKVVGASKQALKNAGRLSKLNATQFKRLSTWNKIKHVDGIKTGYDAAKDLKSDARTVKNRIANKVKSTSSARKAPTTTGRSSPKNSSSRSAGKSLKSSSTTGTRQGVKRSISTKRTPPQTRRKNSGTTRSSNNSRSSTRNPRGNSSSRTRGNTTTRRSAPKSSSSNTKKITTANKKSSGKK